MALPQDADRGDTLHIWRVAVDSRKGVVLQLEGLDAGLINPHRKKIIFLRNITK
jgi:hypothetical protein